MAEVFSECPFYLITRASLAATACLKRALAAAGAADVRPTYLVVLMSLWQEDGLKVIELGRRAGLEPSTMTGLLDRMERDGFVLRCPDPADRRAHRVRLTERANLVRGAAEEAVEKSLDTVLKGVDSEDLDRMQLVLQTILANTDRGVAS